MRYENMPEMKNSHFLSFVLNMKQLRTDIRFSKLYSKESYFSDGYSQYLLHSATSDRSRTTVTSNFCFPAQNLSRSELLLIFFFP